MRLSKLLVSLKITGKYYDCDITEIVTNSKKVTDGCAFICIKGASFDGHSVAVEAENSGAAVIIAERPTGAKNEVLVQNTKEALPLICAAFYGNPADRLCLVGVTGTNGKTSTTYMIKHILESCGKKTGLIGTVSCKAGDDFIADAGLTTPEPPELHRMFNSMVNSGCEYCVMEVSSQALSQKRCLGLNFDTVIFTNLTQDHLDYHKTMDAYAAAKATLFSQSRKALLNKDDAYFDYMSSFVTANGLYTFSAEDAESSFCAEEIEFSNDYCAYALKDSAGVKHHVEVNIPGQFTVYNSMAAIGCCVLLGIDVDDCTAALSQMDGVPGRAEVLKTDTPYTVIIDYAHSPDAIENILTSVRKFAKGRVIALFGCGGDRDKKKRPLMAKKAAENADFVIITSDNPRTEAPNEIIDDIMPGIVGSSKPYAVIPERSRAIEYALSSAENGDVIVLCGKGHETYQIIGKEKIHYDEREEIERLLKK